MSIECPALPYPVDALEPHVSAKTLEFHYGKHHKGYVTKLNAAIGGTAYDEQSLEDIIANAFEAGDTGVFNNAAQIWNHSFLWHSMAAKSGDGPSGPLAAALEERFGGLDGFQSEFRAAALQQFGSGWAWLVRTADGLDIVSTGNAGTPLTGNDTPLLTIDVWEHAYYLDYQNDRAAYVDAFLDRLINWDFANENFAAIRATG